MLHLYHYSCPCTLRNNRIDTQNKVNPINWTKLKWKDLWGFYYEVMIIKCFFEEKYYDLDDINIFLYENGYDIIESTTRE